GITRGLEDAGAERSGDLVVFLPAAFYAEHADDIASLPGVIVRYRPGVTDEQFEAALAKVVGINSLPDFTHSSSTIDALESTARTLATGLLAFALVAALAGLVAITQAFVRQAAVAAPDRRVLGALGASRSQRIVDVVVVLLPVALLGSFLAVAGAWIVSPMMPIGSVRELEVDGSFDFDLIVLGVGALVLALFVLSIGAVAVAWSNRSGVSGHRRRVRASGLPVSVPAGLGVRWALQPGRGATAVPIRSAIAGVALGVAGIVAVAGFAEGLERLTHEPARNGFGWDVGITGERADEPEAKNPDDPALLARHADRIAADPAVDGVALGWLGLRAPVHGRSVPAYAQRVYEPGAGFVVIDGRAPAGPAEVALGAKTMDRAGVNIGDEVKVGDATMAVVGQAVFPEVGEGFPLADGVLFSDDALATVGDALSHENEYRMYGVRLAGGADRDAALERLSALNSDESPEAWRISSDIARLGQLDNLPAYLAIFLFVVASLAVAHALVLSLRRRRQELAVVRALGATRKQAARTVAWQATVIALLGVAIGLPTGLILGRFVWASVANAYGVADDVAWPAFAVVVAIPATILVANAIALWPGRRAARIMPSEALRTE
ncbi:MAG TPA: FtsX-like permease family protein, partial [Acidimicrobiia bacterium]|nr:FtsX-like permease family protein [Acidimicrobiia bacterium]